MKTKNPPFRKDAFKTFQTNRILTPNEKAADVTVSTLTTTSDAASTTIVNALLTEERLLLPASLRSFEDNICHIAPINTSPVGDHVAEELNIKKLNDIHDWLWLAGRRGDSRSLSYQQSSSREIVIDERVDMHLVWIPGRMFLKPIPRYLLDHGFWTRYIVDENTYTSAVGFLRSYVALIQYESGFTLPKRNI